MPRVNFHQGFIRLATASMLPNTHQLYTAAGILKLMASIMSEHPIYILAIWKIKQIKAEKSYSSMKKSYIYTYFYYNY